MCVASCCPKNCYLCQGRIVTVVDGHAHELCVCVCVCMAHYTRPLDKPDLTYETQASPCSLESALLHALLTEALRHAEGRTSDLSVHEAQHEVQQEGLPLAEGAGHRHHDHVQVLHVILQQDLLQSCCIQLEAVLVLVGQDDLDRPGLLFLRHRLKIDARPQLQIPNDSGD